MKFSCSSLLDEIDAICAWLENHGLKPNLSRAADYRQHLLEITQAFEADDFDSINSDVSPYMKTLIELNHLATIYRSFNTEEPEGLADRLKKASTGPVSYADETENSNKPRNFAFELLVAASVRNAGLPCILNARNADVRTKLRGRTINIQCKRLRSSKKVHRNIKKACSQLQEDCKRKKGKRPLGYIFLDATTLLNPIAATFDADNQQTSVEFNQYLLEKFMTEYIDTFASRYPNCLLGIIVHNTILSYDKSDGSYGVHNGMRLFDRPKLDAHTQR